MTEATKLTGPERGALKYRARRLADADAKAKLAEIAREQTANADRADGA
ncbi:MAG TPA: hypothetical protein VNS81_00185 [Nocardioides sp.]|nr:hypothetical protein [Nocardioides sp.]